MKSSERETRFSYFLRVFFSSSQENFLVKDLGNFLLFGFSGRFSRVLVICFATQTLLRFACGLPWLGMLENNGDFP